jgi:hypothetical protein
MRDNFCDNQQLLRNTLVMAGDKKRPAGLAAAKLAKRTKAEAAEPVGATIEPGQATVALPADIDEDDEIGACVALYKTACLAGCNRGPSLLGVPAENWLPLLRGTIHEADRLLRNEDGVKLVYSDTFFAAYGGALLDISDTIDNETAKEGEKSDDYVDAAEKIWKQSFESGCQTDYGKPALDILERRITAVRLYSRIQHQRNKDGQTEADMDLLEESVRVALDKMLGVDPLQDNNSTAANASTLHPQFHQELGVPDLLARACALVDFLLDQAAPSADGPLPTNPAKTIGLSQYIKAICGAYTAALHKDPDDLDAEFGLATCYERKSMLAEIQGKVDDVGEELYDQFVEGLLRTLKHAEKLKAPETVIEMLQQRYEEANQSPKDASTESSD